MIPRDPYCTEKEEEKGQAGQNEGGEKVPFFRQRSQIRDTAQKGDEKGDRQEDDPEGFEKEDQVKAIFPDTGILSDEGSQQGEPQKLEEEPTDDR